MIEISMILEKMAIFLVILAFIIAIVSIVRFSSILIKLVVIEMLTNLLLASIALWALVTHQAVFIDIGLTLALIMFLGIVAYYQYLSKKESFDA